MVVTARVNARAEHGQWPGNDIRADGWKERGRMVRQETTFAYLRQISYDFRWLKGGAAALAHCDLLPVRA